MTDLKIAALAASLLEDKDYHAVRELITMMEPQDVAALLGELPKERLLLAFRLLPKEMAAETFVEMDSDEQELLLAAFSDSEIKEVFDELFLDDTVDIIEEMPANVVWRILSQSDRATRRAINEILNYPPDSAGGIMTIEYVSLRRDMTVDDAFKRIKRTALDRETIYTCYVTDANRTLLGTVTVKTLLLAERDDVIGEIMEPNALSVYTHEDKEQVAKKFETYGVLAIPVVDNENRLVGIVTVDDAIDVLRDETEEDFAKMAAVSVSPDDNTYLKTSVFTHARKRIVWLLILMLSSIVTGALITKFEAAIAAIPALVAFIPMLMDTGGNCGSQASVMVIRGMATDEIKPRDFFRVLRKEALIGLTVGLSLSLVNAVRVLIFYYDYKYCFQLILVLDISLIIIAVLAKSLGCILPMLAKRLKLDPAIMASPMLTTIVDACAVTVYFNIAVHMLPV